MPTRRDGRVVLSICDDGVGGAESGTGSGLVGLIDRVEALDGTIDITSPPGRGTAITVEFRLVPDPQDQEAPAGR